MNPTDNIERGIEQLHITTRAETDKRILYDAFAALEKSAKKQSPQTGFSARPRILRIRIAELAAVAAVILVIFALFFGTSITDVRLGDIYQTLGAIENICITTFEPAANEPMQIEWVSRVLNIDMLRIGEQLVLWDIPNKVKMTKNLSSDSVRTQILSYVPDYICLIRSVKFPVIRQGNQGPLLIAEVVENHGPIQVFSDPAVKLISEREIDFHEF